LCFDLFIFIVIISNTKGIAQLKAISAHFSYLFRQRP